MDFYEGQIDVCRVGPLTGNLIDACGQRYGSRYTWRSSVAVKCAIVNAGARALHTDKVLRSYTEIIIAGYI